jgi:hypothetical protein
MQNTLGVTEETSNIMRLHRNRTKTETKDFMDDFTKHLKIVLDSLEGTQKVFWLVESSMENHTVTVRLGSTLGMGDLPPEVRKMVAESEEKLRAKEDGDGSNVITRTLEGTIPPKPTKSLEERIHEIEEQHPEPHPPLKEGDKQ